VNFNQVKQRKRAIQQLTKFTSMNTKVQLVGVHRNDKNYWMHPVCDNTFAICSVPNVCIYQVIYASMETIETVKRVSS
jgi:hypothetical protein